MGPGPTIESALFIAGFPTVGSCLLDLPQPPAEFNNRFQVIAANIDSWRTRLVTKLKLYRSIITDLMTTSSSISYACDLNARANSSIIDRMDLLAKRFNQLEVRMSSSRNNLLLMRSMIDQLCAMSDSQVLLLSKQFQVLREAHQIAQSLHVPTSSGEAADAEHTVIVGDPCDKVKGLEQTVVTNGNVNLSFRDVVVDPCERVQMSMNTPMDSNSTCGDVLEDRPNITRERDIISRGTERSEKLISRLNATWINPGPNYKFPCPLRTHDHKIAECSEFLTHRSKDRWLKIPRGRICYTCLKPKGATGVFKARQCTEEEPVPQALLCTACTPWAAAKGWAAFSILMCRKLEHGKDRPKPAEIKRSLERYLGRITIPDNKLRYTANFNHQAFSVSETPIPASICTPTFDTELGIEVDTATIVVVPEVPEHSFYLMQLLRIGENNQLTLFDRGAGAHLVQGKMAVASRFELISSHPTSLTVVGGGTLKAEHGSFFF